MKVHLVIESTNDFGKVAYVHSVSPSENIISIDNAISISAYASKKDAQAQVDMLNKLYKGGNNDMKDNVIDKIYGRKISTEHMIDLISWNENDFNIMGLEEVVARVKNDLEYYMEKHEYEHLERLGK